MKPKPLTPFQVAKARKAQARFMSRSRAAYRLICKRAPVRFTLEKLREEIQRAIGESCRYCGKIITAKNFSPDHFVPLSRGGSAQIANIDIICLKCNHEKGMLMYQEFRALLDTLFNMDSVAQQDVLGRLRLGAAAKARWGRRWAR